MDGAPLNVYMVRTSWLDAYAKPILATWDYSTAWRVANTIDSDHADLLIVELPVMKPVVVNDESE